LHVPWQRKVNIVPMTHATHWCELATPIGTLLLAGDAAALTRVHFQSGPRPLRPQVQWRRDTAPFASAIAQLNEYFAGARRTFELALAPAGTPFQLLVWQALRSIPYGETRSYAQLARQIGQGGARAVGLANGANPLPVIVPCHRVIGSDGALTGFGGGLGIKRSLLTLEGAACVADLFSSPASAPPRTHGAAGP
jgi:methylated-DNA-[protein]-cysteine S-methyltransferase